MTRTLRTRAAVGVAGLSILGLVIASVPAFALTNASWNDSEWDSASQGTDPGVATLDCDVQDIFSTRGAGKFLGGQLLSIDLDSVAEAEGMLVTNDGTEADPTPDVPPATALGEDAFANPLSVTVLSAINLQLSGLLQLPLNNDTGVLNQYGQAVGEDASVAYDAGYSAGAAGAVNGSGGIALTEEPPAPGVPTMATFNLDALLSAALGEPIADIVGDLAGVDLQLGAVASSATLDACAAVWDGTQADVYESLVRDYLVAGLSAQIESPLLGALVREISDSTDAIEAIVNGVASNDALLDDIVNGLLGELAPLLGTLGVGTPTITASATIDLSAVQTLLTTPLTDANGVFSIKLAPAPATITVDLAALVDPVNGLNNQAPNTQVLIDDDMINDLSLAVAAALTGWLGDLELALDAAAAAIVLDIDIDLPLSTLLLGEAGTLSVDLDGTPTSLVLDADFVCTNVINVAGCVAGDALELAVDLAAPAIALVIQGIIAPVVVTPIGLIIDTLILTIPTLTAPIVTFLGDALSSLFGEDALVSLVLNAQNAPDPVEDLGYPLPAWGVLDPFVASPYETGRYDVAALRLLVLGTADVVEVDLARASVGSNALN